MSTPAITPTTCVVRDTASRKGRTRTVEPGKTAMRQLHYGRIILDAGDAPVKVAPEGFETGLICLKGSATVRVEGKDYACVPYDALYVPRSEPFEVTPGPEGCDFIELAAHVETRFPVQFAPYADIQQDKGLHFTAGGDHDRRDLNILIGKNMQTGRIMAGITFSHEGNWTSWPPHEHADMLEEAYLYVDMPAPAFGLQLVYTDKHDPELATIVREGDIVLMPQGYHPNVAAPGHKINFVWMMAAHREIEDRQFGVVNVHPDYAEVKSGLDAGRAQK